MRLMNGLAVAIIPGLLLACLAGCLASGGDPVVGTWVWSDDKGYTESYTFYANHSFYAEGLGAQFDGTWEMLSPGHYLVTYWNRQDPGKTTPYSEKAIYDKETDALYFPAHTRQP